MLTHVVVKRGELIGLDNDDCSKGIGGDDVYKSKTKLVLVSLSDL